MYVYIYIYISYICIHVYIYIYIYIHNEERRARRARARRSTRPKVPARISNHGLRGGRPGLETMDERRISFLSPLWTNVKSEPTLSCRRSCCDALSFCYVFIWCLCRVIRSFCSVSMVDYVGRGPSHEYAGRPPMVVLTIFFVEGSRSPCRRPVVPDGGLKLVA